MEEYVVMASLQESRARIRAMLVPDPATGRIEADQFPRSAVMRFVLNARARRIAMAAFSMLLMVAGRRAATRTGLLPLLTQSIGNLAGLVRR